MPRKSFAQPDERPYTREEIRELIEEMWADPDYERWQALYDEMFAEYKRSREH